MAHDLDMTTGAAAIAYFGLTPWHRLGVQMTDLQRRDVAAAIGLARLDWTVKTVPLYRHITVRDEDDGLRVTPHVIEDAKGIIRCDTGAYLGTVGPRFCPVQNRDALGLLEPLVDMGCTVEVMAALNGGRTVFGLLKMPDATVDIGSGDYVNGYVLVGNAHDGTSALWADLTPIRVVCRNTLAAAQRGHKTGIVRLRHSTKVQDRIADARKLMAQMGQAFTETGETFASIAAKRLSPADLRDYIARTLGVEDKPIAEVPEIVKARADTLLRLVYTGKGNARWANPSTGEASAWAAYNAVTQYFDHDRVNEAHKPSAKTSSAESALFGANARIKLAALEYARDLIAA